MVSNGESVIECTLWTLNINKYSHLSKKYVLLTLTSIPT